MKAVLDASALLAFLQGEQGGESVEAVLHEAAISTVNWSEVVQKAMGRAVSVEGLRADLEALGLSITPFSAAQAEQAAELWPQTRALGLSLGDRACLALGLHSQLPVMTTDREWGDLSLSVDVRVLR